MQSIMKMTDELGPTQRAAFQKAVQDLIKEDHAEYKKYGGWTADQIIVEHLTHLSKKAEVQAPWLRLANVEVALQIYASDVRSFPGMTEGLPVLLVAPADKQRAKNWNGPYLNREDILDPWGKQFNYRYPPTHGKNDLPDIWSAGPDGVENTADDIFNWKEDWKRIAGV